MLTLLDVPLAVLRKSRRHSSVRRNFHGPLPDSGAMSYTVLELATLSMAVYDSPLRSVEGWEPLRAFGIPQRHGFFAGLYRKGELLVLAYRGTDDWQIDPIDDAVIAFGSISHQMGQAWDALQASLQIQRSSAGNKLCLTGHSLGGGLAALVAARADLPCVTFNAPGTKRSFDAYYHQYFSGGPYFAPMLQLTGPHEVNDGRILNIRARFDVVSVGTGTSLGVTDSINVHCAGPSGRFVRGPIQAGIDAFLHSYSERLAPVSTLDYSFARGVSNYVICQHQMSRMLSEVSEFDKYKQDLGW